MHCKPACTHSVRGLHAHKKSLLHDIIIQSGHHHIHHDMITQSCLTILLGHCSQQCSSGPRVHCLLFQLLASITSVHVDGRLLQAHRKLQELGDLRGIDYLQSGNLYPEIGPDLAGLSALKLKVDEVGHSLDSLLSVHLPVIAPLPICSNNSFHSCLQCTRSAFCPTWQSRRQAEYDVADT